MVKIGEKYKPKEDLKVICMTAWSAPYTGGRDIILPTGVIFKIANNPLPGATAVYCDVVEYDKWEKIFVPEEERGNPKYSNYYLCIDIKAIENKCERQDGSPIVGDV